MEGSTNNGSGVGTTQNRVERTIKNLSGKYAKRTLTDLEQKNLLSPEVRKIILDGFNDLQRELHAEVTDTL